MGRLKRYLEDDSRVGWLKRVSAWSARGLDSVPGTTPNRITALGLVLALLAALMFFSGAIAVGALLCTLSFLTDFLDGALARYQDERMTDADRAAEADKHWMDRRGKTEDGGVFSGAAFDPLVDKVRYFSALLALDGLTRLWWPLIAAGGLFAVLLTVGRPIVAALKLSKGKSNWLGKHKVHVEAALLAWLVFVPAAGRDHAFADFLLLLATLGGGASLAGQAYSVWKDRKNAKAPT
jgi:phosphatidylglycerophosphate synthase